MSYTCEKHGKLRMSQICPECVDNLQATNQRAMNALDSIVQACNAAPPVYEYGPAKTTLQTIRRIALQTLEAFL